MRTGAGNHLGLPYSRLLRLAGNSVEILSDPQHRAFFTADLWLWQAKVNLGLLSLVTINRSGDYKKGASLSSHSKYK